jgi:hypothetical protein
MTIALFFFAALIVPVRDGCGEDAATVATLDSTDPVTIHYGLRGEVVPCYAVSLVRGGTELHGYVLGSTLPAVEEFERRLAAESRIPAPAPQPGPEASKPDGIRGGIHEDRTIEDPGPLAGLQFPSWTGVDMRSRPVAIPGRGKVTLVVFWRPQSLAARVHAVRIQSLTSKFYDQGLQSVGLIVGASMAATKSSMEDLTLNFPLALDRSSLAREFNVDASHGTTLVLDASGKIVASSSDPRKIQAVVSKLLSSE